MVQEQQGHPIWGAYAQRLLDPEAQLWRNPSSGGHDDKAHPPIHPTKFSAGESGWSQDHHVCITFGQIQIDFIILSDDLEIGGICEFQLILFMCNRRCMNWLSDIS